MVGHPPRSASCTRSFDFASLLPFPPDRAPPESATYPSSPVSPRLFSPGGAPPPSTSCTGLSQSPPHHPFPWRGPNPAAPPAPTSPGPASPTPLLPAGPLPKVPPVPPALFLRGPFPPAGITPLNFFCIVFLSFRLPRCQKQTWRAAFPCLLAAPGRFWALSGLFRVLFGLFRVFFEKSWAKNFPFSPASGIIKPLTGTARR